MEVRVEVGKKRRVSEVRGEVLPYAQNRLEDIEVMIIKKGQRYFVNQLPILVFLCNFEKLCFTWLSNSVQF